MSELLFERPAASRDLYIDRLRSVMTALVILHHTALTYGGSGGWFYYELKTSPAISSYLLTLFCATNQTYFMGFFFLLAGYFTPRSLERKGYALFMKDRFLRLGLPLLAFSIFLGPATAAIVTAFEGKGFWPTMFYLWNRMQFINGPLWFAQALLIFSLAYCLWRALRGPALSAASREPRPLPATGKWFLAALGIAIANVAIRQFVPVGVNVAGLQLGFFPAYIFLFAIGIAAWKHDWLRLLTWRNALPWIVAVLIAWPAMPIGILVARSWNGFGKSNFTGGLSWTALLYATWEPFVAWGAICLWLLVFRSRMNKPSQLWDWLNRRAYAVYILHPLVLVTISLLLHPWIAPALVKFCVTGTLSVVATWLVSDPFVRIPGIRNIV